MKKSLLSLTAAFFTFCVPVKAQLIITDSLDFNQIATLLQGFGTSISNLVYNCDSSAVAQFSGVSELPNLNGMLLSTGKANDLANNAGTFSSTAFGRPGDADLATLSGTSVYDACILEFDCVPLGDTLLFNFTFGSEEYPEFVGAGFNDVFGIFLTGPGGYNNTNIAYVPGSTTPVAINNVNNLNNASFYYDNMNPTGQYCAFDGFTLNLTSVTAVTPNSTYHFKIGVADAADEIFDTGVFLEAYSFRSNMATGLNYPDANGISVFSNAATGEIKLRYKNPAEKNQVIECYDLNGKKSFSFQINEGSLTQSFDVSGLENGIYLVRIMDGNEQLTSKKIVIQK